MHGHITATALAKVEAIAAVADAYAVVCYLDNDTLAVRPTDLSLAAPGAQPLAAVPDMSVSTGLDHGDFFRNCDRHGLSPRYFNSGLMVIDTAAWNRRGMAQRYEASLRAHASHCPYRDGACSDLDQCALNLAAQGAWEPLPLALNVQKSAFQTALWATARIRHFTGPEKFLPIAPHRADALELALSPTSRGPVPTSACPCRAPGWGFPTGPTPSGGRHTAGGSRG